MAKYKFEKYMLDDFSKKVTKAKIKYDNIDINNITDINTLFTTQKNRCVTTYKDFRWQTQKVEEYHINPDNIPNSMQDLSDPIYNLDVINNYFLVCESYLTVFRKMLTSLNQSDELTPIPAFKMTVNFNTNTALRKKHETNKNYDAIHSFFPILSIDLFYKDQLIHNFNFSLGFYLVLDRESSGAIDQFMAIKKSNTTLINLPIGSVLTLNDLQLNFDPKNLINDETIVLYYKEPIINQINLEKNIAQLPYYSYVAHQDSWYTNRPYLGLVNLNIEELTAYLQELKTQLDSCTFDIQTISNNLIAFNDNKLKKELINNYDHYTLNYAHIINLDLLYLSAKTALAYLMFHNSTLFLEALTMNYYTKTTLPLNKNKDRLSKSEDQFVKNFTNLTVDHQFDFINADNKQMLDYYMINDRYNILFKNHIDFNDLINYKAIINHEPYGMIDNLIAFSFTSRVKDLDLAVTDYDALQIQDYYVIRSVSNDWLLSHMGLHPSTQLKDILVLDRTTAGLFNSLPNSTVLNRVDDPIIVPNNDQLNIYTWNYLPILNYENELYTSQTENIPQGYKMRYTYSQEYAYHTLAHSLLLSQNLFCTKQTNRLYHGVDLVTYYERYVLDGGQFMKLIPNSELRYRTQKTSTSSYLVYNHYSFYYDLNNEDEYIYMLNSFNSTSHLEQNLFLNLNYTKKDENITLNIPLNYYLIWIKDLIVRNRNLLNTNNSLLDLFKVLYADFYTSFFNLDVIFNANKISTKLKNNTLDLTQSIKDLKLDTLGINQRLLDESVYTLTKQDHELTFLPAFMQTKRDFYSIVLNYNWYSYLDDVLTMLNFTTDSRVRLQIFSMLAAFFQTNWLDAMNLIFAKNYKQPSQTSNMHFLFNKQMLKASIDFSSGFIVRIEVEDFSQIDTAIKNAYVILNELLYGANSTLLNLIKQLVQLPAAILQANSYLDEEFTKWSSNYFDRMYVASNSFNYLNRMEVKYMFPISNSSTYYSSSLNAIYQRTQARYFSNLANDYYTSLNMGITNLYALGLIKRRRANDPSEHKAVKDHTWITPNNKYYTNKYLDGITFSDMYETKYQTVWQDFLKSDVINTTYENLQKELSVIFGRFGYNLSNNTFREEVGKEMIKQSLTLTKNLNLFKNHEEDKLKNNSIKKTIKSMNYKPKGRL